MPGVPVLIVGAGPTGLVLALSLARRGISFRLITEAVGPGEHSRAMVVQARTLEFYDQLGIADEVVRQGVIAGGAHLIEHGHQTASFSFKELGEGLSPYPFALAYAQDDHERFLVEQLKALGSPVEWNSKLAGFVQDERSVRVTVVRDGHNEEIEADYICGCDGAHSCVRETLGIGFPGGTYEQQFYVADVKIASGFERDLYFSLGRQLLVLMFPVRSSGMQRLIGLVPPELSAREELSFEDIRPNVEPLLGIRVTDVNWFSAYRVHHRVAERFRSGRAFLLGDAGHIHSPVGGQGMNTGIGDAINLAWKLAQVIQERAAGELLETYEQERIGFARVLVSTTDRAFTPITAGGLGGEFIRRFVAPFFFTAATHFDLSRHAIFRLVSQTRIHYAESPLSSGRAGEVHGGDRLPRVRMHSGDNFSALRSLEWQMHVYGQIQSVLAAACHQLGLQIQAFPWSPQAERAGLQRNAAYLVRPDGYVSLANGDQEASAFIDFVDRFALRFPVHSVISPFAPRKTTGI
ncbi:MAG TPA: FAD-dependent monooxygenase [Acidobacteriaceae bacterium]|nr:FAD-dependent monooxygenase [Acidobacteriaceae bacterium]